MTDLPAAALTAAFAASPFANHDAVRHALEAAAPHITAAATAAERERIIQLATDMDAFYVHKILGASHDYEVLGIETPFADLLREDTP